MTGPRVEHLRFQGSAGGSLDARLDLPDGVPTAYALFAHCFTCSKELPAATQIARGLVEHGIAVLRFDFTGLGASEGDFVNTNFSTSVDDFVRAAAMLRHRFDAPQLLVGHSLGGAVVLAAAAQVPEATAVVTIGAPFEPAEVTRLFPGAMMSELARAGEATLEIAGRRISVRRQLLDDVNAQDLQPAIEGLQRALLVLHAPSDELVAIDNARRILDAAVQPKSFVSLDDADHLLTRRSDAAYVAHTIAAWASRYLTDHSSDRDVALPKGTVVVGDSRRGRIAQEIRAGRHALFADEPPAVGDDAGPTPHELLLASLGACTAMTLRLYAGRKGWPLDHVAIQLTHGLEPIEDGGDGPNAVRLIDRIERSIELIGPLTEVQRERLVEIAKRCPIHRTLVGEKRIVTRLQTRGAGTAHSNRAIS